MLLKRNWALSWKGPFIGRLSFHTSRIIFIYFGTLNSSFLNLIWGMNIAWTSQIICKGDLVKQNPRQILSHSVASATALI